MGHAFPVKLAKKLAGVGQIKTCVETGTYKGDSTLKAAEIFEKVYTIEGDENRYNKTLPRFREVHNITPVLGNSRTTLREVLNRVHSPVMFWLDAHWCGGGAFEVNAAQGDECPLLDELAAIRAHNLIKYHVVIIDDARLFVQPPPPPHDPAQWPDLDQIRAALPQFDMRMSNDVICMVHSNNPLKGITLLEDWFE